MTAEQFFIHVGMKRALQGDRTTANRARSIRAAVPDKLQNQVYQYIASLSIGTPVQVANAAIDTGSSDLWVFSNKSGLANSFNPSKSNSYTFLNNGFQIQYVSGSANGDWVTDNVQFGGDKVSALQFATVDSQTAEGETAGVFGIGQANQETSAQSGSTYPNFPVALKQQGKIKTVAYSLFLDSISESNGSSVTFGAVDTSKYTGNLYTVPFTSQVSFNVDFQVAGTTSNGVLDSGTSLTYLDQATADKIAATYGAEWDDNEKSYILPSSATLASFKPLVYTFGQAQIEVPISELFIQETQNGPQVLTILPTTMSQGVVLLGDSFLRSAYVIYHLDANIAGIAQANWTPGSQNFVPITGNTIPGSAN